MKTGCWLAIIFLLLGSVSYAGGPFRVDEVGKSGVALQWKENTLIWYSEDGRLSRSVDNATAVQWVKDAFASWQNVMLKNANGEWIKTANLQIVYGGSVGKDVTKDNVDEYTTSDPGQTVVVFDEDGSIIKKMLGDQRSSIVGLTALLLSEATGKKILKGISIFDGSKMATGILADNDGRIRDLFRANILHELGHLLNLDHTQINLDIALNCSPETPCEGSQYLPTMFPELKTPLQMSPSIDDKVTLSWIYPDPNFNSKFCMATGKIVDAAGKPLRGVNVIASRVDDGDSLTRSDARSMVSGVLYPGCLGDSAYYLYGFVPGKKYHVTYEPLAEQYAGHSGFEPLDQPPSGFASGTIEAENGETVIGCEAGNTVIPMKTVTIDVKNTCLFSRQTTNTNTSTAPGSAGGCSFMRLQ